MSIHINTSAGEQWAEQFAIYTQDDVYIPRIYVNGKLSYSCGLNFSESMSGWTATPAANVQGYVTIPSHLSPDDPVVGLDGFAETYVREVKILGRMAIPDRAFYDCRELSYVVAKPSVGYDSTASIGTEAFAQCNALRTVDFSTYSPLQTIGSSAFKGCTSLTSILLPQGLKTIGSSAFEGCTSLESIVIPSTVTEIAASAFRGCTSLKNIHLGGVITIGDSAFSGCNQLQSVTGCSYLTRIFPQAFDGCTWLTSFAFKPALVNIGSYAFRGCSQLNIRASLSNTSLRGIGTGAFSGNTCATVALPNSIRFIAMSAFYNSSLSYATLPIGKWIGVDSGRVQQDSINVTSTTSTTAIAICLNNRYLSWEYNSSYLLTPIICIKSSSDSLDIGVYRENYSSEIKTRATIQVLLGSSTDESSFNQYYIEEYTHESDTNKVFILNPVSAYLIRVNVTFDDGQQKATATLVNPMYDESTSALIDEQNEE
jgi:hypothetical protein